MATKIRLQRRGRKRNAIYHIVAIDSRAKRDGRCIERLGQYNPNVNPAMVDLDFERALHWVKVGAEMSDTAKTILSKEGVLLKNHLDGGVTKGAFKQEESDKKFAAWKTEKESGADKAAKSLADKEDAEAKKQLEAETKIKEERAAAILAKNSALAEEAAAEAAPAEASADEAEAPVAEEAKEEVVEPVAEDKKEEEKPAE